MSFIYEPEPPRGRATVVAPGIRRIVARNPSPMAYHGTNTYLVDTAEGLLVIDPGPEGDDDHVETILREAAGPVAYVVLTHGHRDHFGAVAALCRATGAPLASFVPSAAEELVPDVTLADKATFAGMEIVHIPGHSADHIGLARTDGYFFSGDHVMAWCSTVVGPGGDMGDFCRSLRLLIAREDRVYLPGHGPALPDPRPHVQRLLDRRMQREAEIEAALKQRAGTIPDLAATLYAKADPVLRRASERNVDAHLRKLAREGRAAFDGAVWRAV